MEDLERRREAEVRIKQACNVAQNCLAVVGNAPGNSEPLHATHAWLQRDFPSPWRADSRCYRYTEGAKAAKAEFEAVHGKPKKAEKKPPNAYALFVKENFAAAKGNSNDSAPAVMKKLSHQWKALSAQEKSKYKSS